MPSIINTILPVFLLILLGWLCVKIRIFKRDQSVTFNNYAYYIALPVLIFQSLSKLEFTRIIGSHFVLVTLLAIVLMTILVYGFGLLLKVHQKSLAMFVVACFLGNVAFIGIPFNFLLFGQEGTVLASINSALVTFMALTLGLYLIEKQIWPGGKKRIWLSIARIFTKPIVLAVLIGLLFSFFRLSLPRAIDSTLNLIAASTSAVALFAVGIFIYGSSLKKRIGTSLILTLGSLVVMPAVAWLTSLFFNLTPVELAVTILQAGMPLATMNFILAHQFHLEEETIANSILVSTLFSAVTLPVLIWLVV